jgi:hypothetical protein
MSNPIGWHQVDGVWHLYRDTGESYCRKRCLLGLGLPADIRSMPPKDAAPRRVCFSCGRIRGEELRSLPDEEGKMKRCCICGTKLPPQALVRVENVPNSPHFLRYKGNYVCRSEKQCDFRRALDARRGGAAIDAASEVK